MATSEFDQAMAMRPAGLPGVYRATLDDGWAVGMAVNGGVLMGLAATAVQQALAGGGHDDPLAVSAHFLSAAEAGPVRIATEVLRRGRSVSAGQARLTQADDSGEVERMRALVTFGDLAASREALRSSTPPDVPDPDECLSASEARADAIGTPALMHRLDLRLDPETAGWARGEPSGRGEMRAWVRLADGREPDPVALLFFLDAMPPVAFDLGITGWAPTLEFSGHVRARPAPGWLRIATRSENLSGGLLEEDAWIWDSTGRLVAQSRQLCSVRMPRS